ncbi:MAG TPA: nuclear transport factor 2 family protein [Chitinophagaceae bacterium]|jgi:hypothetical protein|nr:nuclear transport factor 2 family protein [Chitinophagaceae bacterium]
MTKDEEKAMIDTIQKTFRNYYNDLKTLGLTAEFKYLDSSSNFFWVPPGYPSAISYDSVATILKQNAAFFKSIDNRFEDLRIIPLSKELATYTARLHSTMTDTTGNTSNISLVETGVLIKRKDGWKLLSGQTAVIK